MNKEEMELGLQEAIIEAIEAGFNKAEVMDIIQSVLDNWNIVPISSLAFRPAEKRVPLNSRCDSR
jgi:hypothetical protein